MEMKRSTINKPVVGLAIVGMLFLAMMVSPAMDVWAGNAGVRNIPDYKAIEADVILNGTGTGCHAKLAFVSSYSACSFGIQYDEHAIKPYNGKAVLMVENVRSNKPGGQDYDWPGGGIVVEKGKPCHLMLSLSESGDIKAYYNGDVIGTYHNDGLRKGGWDVVYPRTEGSARLQGDSVDARFENISLKVDKEINGRLLKSAREVTTNQTIKAAYDKKKNIVSIQGAISGIGPKGDWDKNYASVSGVVQFFCR